MNSLSLVHQKLIFQRLFPQFQQVSVPFQYGPGPLFRAVVEPWGRGDLLVLLLHQEHYIRTESRYTPETVNRKLTPIEAIRYFYLRATEDQVQAIAKEFMSTESDPCKPVFNQEVIMPAIPPTQFSSETKLEEVPDDLLGKFGEYKKYDPLWALRTLSARQKKRNQQVQETSKSTRFSAFNSNTTSNL